MKNATIAERILDFLANNPGRHRSSQIAEAIGASSGGTSTALGKLATNGEITQIQQGTYIGNDDRASTPAQTRPGEELEQISEALRSADANGKTIDKLLNLYDSVLDNYETWVGDNVDSNTDFEKQLLFIENFKWLTAIGDKLMKRWSLVHVGYDTNTRQAQEDAKAKTEERQKEALKDAPLEDTVAVVGHFHEDLKELWDKMPPSEKEKQTV